MSCAPFDLPLVLQRRSPGHEVPIAFGDGRTSLWALPRRSSRLRRPPTLHAADGSDSVQMAGGPSNSAGQHLQLGVGQSVIFDLPEEAGEIYVGDPNVANAIVRSAKRVYISGVSNGQTSIFALARDGRKIAVVQVSVGRDVGELSNRAQHRHPRQRNSRAHSREHDHPDRVGCVRRGGAKGDGYRSRLRQQFEHSSSPEAPASISVSNGSGGASPGRRRRREVVQRSRKSDQRADDPRARPGQPARDGRRDSSGDPQAARRQSERHRAERKFHARQSACNQRHRRDLSSDPELGQRGPELQRDPSGV